MAYQDSAASNWGTAGFLLGAGAGLAAGASVTYPSEFLPGPSRNIAFSGHPRLGLEVAGTRLPAQSLVDIPSGTAPLFRNRWARGAFLGGNALVGAIGVGMTLSSVADAAYDPTASGGQRLLGATTRGAIGGGILGAGSIFYTAVSNFRRGVPSAEHIGTHLGSQVHSAIMGNPAGHTQRVFHAGAVDPIGTTSPLITDPTRMLPGTVDPNAVGTTALAVRPKYGGAGTTVHGYQPRGGGATYATAEEAAASTARGARTQAMREAESIAARTARRSFMSADTGWSLAKGALHKGLWGMGIGAVAGLAIGAHGMVSARGDKIHSNAPMY